MKTAGLDLVLFTPETQTSFMCEQICLKEVTPHIILSNGLFMKAGIISLSRTKVLAQVKDELRPQRVQHRTSYCVTACTVTVGPRSFEEVWSKLRFTVVFLRH